MINYFKIRKYGKFYILPFTTMFCVSKKGIEAFGAQDPLWELKPGDIKAKGVDTVAIVQELEREYRRLHPKPKEQENETAEEEIARVYENY